MDDEITILKFSAFGPTLDEAIATLLNRMEREDSRRRKATPHARELLRLLLLVANNDYRTIRLFTADYPSDSKPSSEHALSVTPLSRSILDATFAAIFLLEDPDMRTTWFFKSGWREYDAETRRLMGVHSSDPHWAKYLANRKTVGESEKRTAGVTAEEEAAPASIKWWPTPPQMVAHAGTSQKRRDYMAYLQDWFYREFSQDSHLSWPGLTRRAAYLALVRDNGAWERVQKQKSDSVLMTVIVMLAMLSEIEVELGYDLAAPLLKVWYTLIPACEAAKELFVLRYKHPLEGETE